MAQISSELKNLIKKFLEKLEKDNIRVQQAILYGSYAKGNYNEWSDIDLALVSDDFIGNRILDKERMIKSIVDINTSISPLPYRPEDFDESDLFVREIIRTGIRIV
jgi:predicted nucleotidyltransferase